MSQVIHSRPEAAPKASHREAVNSNRRSSGDSRPYCGWQPFCPGVATVGSTSPCGGFVKNTADDPAASVQKSERTSPREGHRIRLTMNRVIPTSGAAKSQRKESRNENME